MLSSSKIPEIKIKRASLLEDVFLTYAKNHPDHKDMWEGWDAWKEESVKTNIQSCKKLWSTYEEEILDGMIQATGLNFSRKLITVYCVQACPRNLSEPVIIRSTLKPEDFFIALTHELVHEILNINSSDFDIKAFLQKIARFSDKEEVKSTLNHVIVYAVMEYLFKEVINKSEFSRRNYEIAQGAREYARAFEIIEINGYRKILDFLKENR